MKFSIPNLRSSIITKRRKFELESYQHKSAFWIKTFDNLAQILFFLSGIKVWSMQNISRILSKYWECNPKSQVKQKKIQNHISYRKMMNKFWQEKIMFKQHVNDKCGKFCEKWIGSVTMSTNLKKVIFHRFLCDSIHNGDIKRNYVKIAHFLETLPKPHLNIKCKRHFFSFVIQFTWQT